MSGDVLELGQSRLTDRLRLVMDAHPDLVVGILMLGLFSLVFGFMFELLWWSAHHVR